MIFKAKHFMLIKTISKKVYIEVMWPWHSAREAWSDGMILVIVGFQLWHFNEAHMYDTYMEVTFMATSIMSCVTDVMLDPKTLCHWGLPKVT